jgi:hypothetical protein
MTAHNRDDRYPNLDIVLDELTWTLVALGIPTTTPSTEEADKKILIRLLRSTNAEHQAQAHEIAKRLAEKALPELHELTGDRRLDVALAAYRLLGNLAHKDSLPYLTAGLYPRRSSQKPRFVTGEAAAEALRNYPPDDRIFVLKAVKDLVLAAHLARVVDGIPADVSCPIVENLRASRLIYKDWSRQTGLALLLRLDQDRAWQLVEQLLARQDHIYSFTIFGDLYTNVTPDRQLRLIDYMLTPKGDLSSWEFNRVLIAITAGQFPPETALDRIEQMKTLAASRIRKWEEREAFIDAAIVAARRILAARRKRKTK